MCKPEEKSRELIPSYFLPVLFGVLCLLGYLTFLIDDSLPSVVRDEEAGTEKFSEERAWRYLLEIVGDGPRVAGSRYHLKKTEELRSLLKNVTEGSVQKVHTDWQIISGDYILEGSRPYVAVYDRTSNIIALLEGESGFNGDGTTNTSVILNCHYDTVPTSPGASDNALFCAAMVETLWILSRRPQKFKHNIVFLFNGAEELSLMAVPGFLKHDWSKGVTGLVNLDATGMNGKSFLFQVTDPRVLHAYRKTVSRPSAQALGEVLFTSGIIPSDTDFRIFRDFGQIYGIDIAFIKMGHVYHTRHDSIEYLKGGVLQHSGNMILDIISYMADSDDFYTKIEPSNSIYWDYLNLFMFSYNYIIAYVVDILIVIFAIIGVVYYHWIVGFRLSMTEELCISVLSRIAAAAAGAAIVWIITPLMVATTQQLRYLSYPWIVVPIFWAPFFIGSVIASQYFDAWRCHKSGLNRVRRMSQAMASTRLIVILITVILLCIPGTGTFRYVLTVPLFLMSVAAFISLFGMRKFIITVWQQLILVLVLAIPSLLLTFMVAIKINTVMLPIMGRSPTKTPDYVIGILNTAVVLLSSMPLSGIELLFSRLRLWAVAVAALIACLLITFLPLKPYRESDTSPALQRHTWVHSEIVNYNQNQTVTDRKTGIWMGVLDVNSPKFALRAAEDAGIVLRGIKTDFQEDCNEYVYCNFPVISPRNIDISTGSVWVDFSPPITEYPTPSLTLTRRNCIQNSCILDFRMIGPSHMTLVIWPREGVNLTSWSLDAPFKTTTIHKERPAYFIFYGRNTYIEPVTPYEFSLTFSVAGHDLDSKPIVDIMFNAHRINDEARNTNEYDRLLKAMPDWFNIATILSRRHNLVF